jgi:putative ABC transport system permease protein
MNTPIKKAFRDLAVNKSRTILVILAIFFGVFGTGLILDLYSVAGREMDNSYMATNPYSFSIRINDYDADLITSLCEINGVEQVEARRTVRARTEIAPDVWRTSYLYVIEDFADVRIDTFTSVRGASVPGIREVLIEKESLPVIGREPGETANIKISLNSANPLSIVGSVHAPGLKPAWMEKTVYGFITPETLGLLGVASENCDLLFVVSEDMRFEKAAIQKIAFEIRDMLFDTGYKIDRVTVPTPGKHPNGDQMNALLFLFQLFGGLSLILSGVLVINMISSMLSGQVRQIGIMRSCGAVSKDILHIVIFEGVFIGVISWAISMLLSIPLSFSIGDMFGGIFLQTSLDNTLSPLGYALWLIIVITTSASVSLGVTLKALEMPVNEVLSYE